MTRKPLDAPDQLLDRLERERADGDRPQQADLDPALTRLPHCGKRHTSGRAEADDHEFGIVEEIFLVADLIALDGLPAGQKPQVGLLLFNRVQIDGSQDAALSLAHPAIGGPVPVGALDRSHLRHPGRFHHLADSSRPG